MKILYVIGFFPFPPRGGGYLRAANLITQLSRNHALHLVCLGLSKREQSAESRLLGMRYAKSIRVIPHSHSRRRAFLRQFLTLKPYEVALTQNLEMSRAVKEAIGEINPDAILCSRLSGAQFISTGLQPLTILDQHDLARYLWSTFAKGNPHWWMRVYCRFNRLLVKAYEVRHYPKFQACISVSEEERKMTAEFAPSGLRLLVAPNGVDASYFHPMNEIDVKPKTLVLTGTMSQERNIEAAKLAAYTILPALQKEFPAAELVIVGRNPTNAVRRLARLEGVTVTGEVNDVRPYIASAEVVLAPYFFGSGVKHKVPIAMAMAKAIVGTPNAFQGIRVADNVHVMIGDSPEYLVDKVKVLFRDVALRKSLEQNAFQLATREYTWDSIVKQLDAELFAKKSDSEQVIQ